MTLDTRRLRRQAGQRLQNIQNPKRLVLIHTAVALGATLLVTGLNWILNKQIAGTGGLSGMELRSVLVTIQSVLELVVRLGLPFWEIGLLFAALGWVSGEHVGVPHLLQGFRRFGSVLGMRLIRGALFFALGIAISNISSIIFMLLPFSGPLIEHIEPIVQETATPEQLEALITQEWLMTLFERSIPLLAIFGVLYGVVAILVFYRLRFADFGVLEGKGAVRALVQSARMTKGSTLQLIKLDLSFWWYYLPLLLCILLSVMDMILFELGVSLPVSQDAGFFLFFGVSAVCQGVLQWQCRGKVTATYALAYRTLGQPPKIPTNSEPPVSVPWEE